MALILAAIGLYGIISYSVAQRRGEIGVRVALGASRRDVLGLVLRQGMILTTIGLLTGLVVALVFTRALASLVFGIGTADPLTLIGVAAFLSITALLASYLPARRAARVDPMIAMRPE